MVPFISDDISIEHYKISDIQAIPPVKDRRTGFDVLSYSSVRMKHYTDGHFGRNAKEK